MELVTSADSETVYSDASVVRTRADERHGTFAR